MTEYRRGDLAAGAAWCVLLLAAASSAVTAQPTPVKWGKVAVEDLRTDTATVDSSANAVILADYGVSQVSPRDGSVTFERHTRVRILADGGAEWGTVVFSYHTGTGDLKKVEGQTFLLVGGKVEKHKLSKNDVFKEDVDGEIERVKFALPALKAGAIVEYRYRIKYDNPWLLPSWEFQSEIPTLHSEYRAEIPRRFDYVRVRTGFIGFTLEDSEIVNRPGYEGWLYRWVMTNVPPLKEEPFMTSVRNYRSRLELQLHSYYARGHGPVQVLGTWEALAKELRAGKEIKKQFDPPGKVRDAAEALVAETTDPLRRLQIVYDFVRSSIAWDGTYGVISDDDQDDVLERKTSDAAGISALLTGMLNAAGIQANPVLISTRSHGSVLKLYPLLSQFNYVITRARIGTKTFLLDATDRNRPYDLLPYRALNSEGWSLTESGAKWIQLSTKGRLQRRLLVVGELDQDGLISGTIQMEAREYAAIEVLAGIKEDGAEDYFRSALFSGIDAVALDSVEVKDADATTGHVSVSARFAVSSAAQSVGDFLYVNPIVADRWDENPLKAPERKFPVDMAYRRSYDYIARLALPPGYVVEDVMPSLEVRLPTGGASYRVRCGEADGVVTFSGRLNIAKVSFKSAEYAGLREFFDRVVAAHEQQVVLRRDGG